MQLKPREYFTIARGLTDHTDSDTYYVRAVIRNARTDALIDTVNLTDQGNRRFSRPWQTPADTSGEGFYILITTTVYTDSDYTTKAANYGEEFDTYLVQERYSPVFGNGSGPDIDYKKVRTIVADEVGQKIHPVDLTGLEKAVREARDVVVRAVSAIRMPDIPKVDPVDLSPVLASLTSLEKAVRSIPKPADIDLSPISHAVQRLENVCHDVTNATASQEKVRAVFLEDVAAIHKSVTDLRKEFTNMTFTTESTVKRQVPTNKPTRSLLT